MTRWPHVLLQWEDFAKANATRLLDRYRDRLCTFNDDIQGTAAVATGTLLSAIGVTGVPLAEQRIAIFGAGSAGCGIAGLLMAAMVEAGVPAAEAARAVLHGRSGRAAARRHEFDRAVPAAVRADRVAVASWPLDNRGRVTLLDVVRNAKPTTLIGVSGQPGAFSERRAGDGREQQRPVIFPLSNPTSRAEATPADIEIWSEGRAVIGTGSPFPPLMRGRPAVRRRSDQQLLHLSGRRPRRHRGAGAPHHRHHVHGGGEGAGGAVAGAARSGCQSAAAGYGAARGVDRGGAGRGPTGAPGGPHRLRREDEIDAAILAKMWSPQYLPYRRTKARHDD